MKTLLLALFLTVSVVATGQDRNRGGRGSSQDSRQGSVPVSKNERPAGRTPSETSTNQPVDPPIYQSVVPVPVSMPIIQTDDYQRVIPHAENLRVILMSSAHFPGSAGFDFSEEAILSADDNDADIVLEQTAEGFAMFVPEDGDIQDIGRTNSINDISTAPRSGWAELKSVQLSVEHSYAVCTWDKKYYKFRVVAMWQDSALFDWGPLTPWRNLITRSNDIQSVANKFPQ